MISGNNILREIVGSPDFARKRATLSSSNFEAWLLQEAERRIAGLKGFERVEWMPTDRSYDPLCLSINDLVCRVSSRLARKALSGVGR